MRKIVILIFSHLIIVTVFAQKKLPNPKIDKNETEIILFNFLDSRKGLLSHGRDALGCQIVYRLSWKKYTKVGAGLLIAADYSNDHYDFEKKVFAYGAAFADITQFIGKRQKWSVGGQAGHGFYKRKYQYDDPTGKGFNKYTGGMYYSLSVNYREILSKKILIFVSPFVSIRNFRHISVFEYYTPPSVQKNKQTEYHDGVGLRIGIVF